MDCVTSVNVCPKSSAPTRLCLSKFGGVRGVVCNEMDLHGEVRTKRLMLSMTWWEIEGFPFDSRGWLSENLEVMVER